MVGPSAMGSENGTPSSITSAPAATSACITGTVASSDGSPAVTKGINALRPRAASWANRDWMRLMQEGSGGRTGRTDTRSDATLGQPHRIGAAPEDHLDQAVWQLDAHRAIARRVVPGQVETGRPGVLVQRRFYSLVRQPRASLAQRHAATQTERPGRGKGFVTARQTDLEAGDAPLQQHHSDAGRQAAAGHLGTVRRIRPVRDLPAASRNVRRERLPQAESRHAVQGLTWRSARQREQQAGRGQAHAHQTSTPSRAAMVCTSLSPRPDRLHSTSASRGSSRASFIAWAMAWLDSSAGRMPSVRVSLWKAASASSSVTPTYSARPVSLRKACSGPTPG